MAIRSVDEGAPLLEVENVSHSFTALSGKRGNRKTVRAVSDVSFTIQARGAVGVVGESGSGKTSLARAIMLAPRPDTGSIWLHGEDITSLNKGDLRRVRRNIQMVSQDPYSSLDSRWEVEAIIREPLDIFQIGTAGERRQRVRELLELVGLAPQVYSKMRPRQLSGGQCQRVAIARAISISPSLLICDEAVSSLDVSIQAQILNLLADLRHRLGLTVLFIGHDLGVVRYVSETILVMYFGKIVEMAPSDEVCLRPFHPYTAALLSATTELSDRSDLAVAGVEGEPPSPFDPPSGCSFRMRCPRATTLCSELTPELIEISPGRRAACHFPLTIEDRPD